MGADVISLLIFVAIIVIFIIDKIPMATTAAIGCVAMVVFGACDFDTAFSSYASSTVILLIGISIFGAAIASTGLARYIGEKIVKASKGSETKLIIGTYIVSAVMSAFLTNASVLAIFIPIIMGLSLSDENIKAKNLIMPIAVACILGGATTLVGSTQQMTAQGLLMDAGVKSFKTFDFVPVAGIITLAGLVYCLTIGRNRAKAIWGNDARGSYDEESFSSNHQIFEYTKPKMIIVGIVFCITVVLYITEWLPLPVTSSIAAIICIVTGCIKQSNAIKAVNWNIVGRLAGCLGLANALEAAGGTDLIAKIFSSLIGDSINPFVFFCILVALVRIISTFISNSTAVLIVMPLLITVAPGLGLNIFPFALGITISSGIALSSPLASSTLGLSQIVGYGFNDYFKYGIIFDVISYILLIILVPAMYSLTI